MKVLLVVKSKFMESLGVMYLKSVIQHDCQHECIITDLASAEKVAEKWQPEIVGFSIMTGDMERFRDLNMRLQTHPVIIVGGPDPTFFPEGYDWADTIIKGEAEQAMADLLQTGQKYDGIDSLPWPARDDFPNMKVRDFISSRGCPYKCNYCYNAQWAELFPEQKGVRTRDAEDVVAEICNTVRDHKAEYIYFQDSCFGVNMGWMEEFSNLYKERVNLPWQCNFRPEQITEHRADLLKASNCVAVRMALESASNRLRGLIGRTNIKLKTVREAAWILKDYGIQLMLQNIIGLPTATIEDDLFTLEQNILYKPTYSWVSIFQPYPGTALGNQCKEEGWYSGDYSDITDSFFETSHLMIDHFYREQLEVLQKVFALCSEKEYLPTPDELTYENLPKLIHKIMRKDCDRKLYVGLL
jgi:anaerobic magnesium-protoporphyrin IX monomethyl ester cyclase